MDAQNIREAVKDAAESIRKSPPVRRRKSMAYALAVKAGYDVIQKLLEDGYSYDVICGELAERGALPSGASPKNLCSAFLREKKRKEKRSSAAAASSSPEVKKTGVGGFRNTNREAGSQAMPQKPNFPDDQKLVVNPDNTFNIRPTGLSESDIEDIEKRLNEKTYNTGTGFKITKHSNGSFDFE
jgi:hypothetical protein